MKSSALRPLVGLASIVVLLALVFVSLNLFRGGFTTSVPVTIISDRAGLVMNPDARVKMRGVQVGKVASIDELSDGRARLRLAMDPSQLHLIPSNVLVNIASSTVFGAKYIQLVPPDKPVGEMTPNQTLDAKHVTVEINTVFSRLTQVLSGIQPEKLNETLGA
ncbi:MAG: phospholipid/cholesterol/gamma-HCH transport system substrate-binding protein, partial [Mycobacterium sp.]|nr:phospholipid/cholesterol/gamma-HCH transport system substrate-binding protein [Mycobacterium sp.]